MSQSSAGKVTAAEVEMRQSAAANLNAENLSMQQCGVLNVQVGSIKAADSALGIVKSESITIEAVRHAQYALNLRR